MIKSLVLISIIACFSQGRIHAQTTTEANQEDLERRRRIYATDLNIYNFSGKTVYLTTYKKVRDGVEKVPVDEYGKLCYKALLGFKCSGVAKIPSKLFNQKKRLYYGYQGANYKMFVVISTKEKDLKKKLSMNKLNKMVHYEIPPMEPTQVSRDLYYFIIKENGKLILVFGPEIPRLDKKAQQEINNFLSKPRPKSVSEKAGEATRSVIGATHGAPPPVFESNVPTLDSIIRNKP